MREVTIGKILRKMRTLNSMLVKEYDSKMLAKYLELERELQIQQCYEQQEGK